MVNNVVLVVVAFLVLWGTLSPLLYELLHIGKISVGPAEPLRFNGYKIPLMRNLVKRAISGVEEAKWA